MQYRSRGRVLGLAVCLALCAISPATATVVTQWTFEAAPVPASFGSATGPSISATTGVGTFFGKHESALSSWSNEAGNGSANSYGARYWQTGSYWQFSFSTVGYESLSLSFDVASAANGPRDFNVQTSTDGINYTDTGVTYKPLFYGGEPQGVWVANATKTEFRVTTPLSDHLSDLPAVWVRLMQTSDTSISGGAINLAHVSRIDNVTVSGTAIAAVPEASSVAMMLLVAAAVGTACAMRWRPHPRG